MFSRRLGIRPRPFLRRLTGRRHFGANFGIYGIQLSQMDMLYFQLPSSHSGRGGRSKTVQPPILKHALRLHQDSDAHFPPIARGISTNGAPTWQEPDANGLNRLNRYCFRCHGSVYFSVYDRARVLAIAGDMQARIKPNPNQLKRSGFKMPPDRTLDPAEVQAIYDFLE